MQAAGREYRPFYIARMNACVWPDKQRLAAIAGYDYMGSSYFEGGACGASTNRMRLAIAGSLLNTLQADHGMQIVKAPEALAERLTAKRGVYQGRVLHVLAHPDTLKVYGDSLWEKLVAISEDKVRLEEPAYLANAFKEPGRFSPESQFDAWHDIKNDLFFSFSEEYLEAILATLCRDFDIPANVLAQQFEMGHQIEGLKQPANQDLQCAPSTTVEKWRKVSGRVVGVSENHVTVKSHGKTHRILSCLVTSLPAANVTQEKVDALRARVGRTFSFI